VVPADVHDFFATSGGAAGALIGLLFVAISVSAERLAREEAGAQLHRIRAAAALTAFINALTISLFSLVPEDLLGGTALSVAIVGLLFVAASIVSLVRLREVHWGTARDGVFLAGLGSIFVIQLVSGEALIVNPDDSGAVNTIAILVVACFLVGIGRAWELIGGPSIGLTREVTALVLRRDHESGKPANAPADGEPPPPEPRKG
jgi:hypothetical protein